MSVNKGRQVVEWSRWRFGAAFICMLLIEAGIALWVHDQFVRPYLGDMLVVVVVYLFVRIFFPKGVPHLPFYVFLFAAAVEVTQYFNLVGLLGLQNSRAARIILGSVFDWKDIACYGAGCLLLAWLERHLKVK